MTVYPDDQDPSFTVAYTDKSVADDWHRQARKWEWVATHTYVCPLGEMNPGEPGSYVIEVRPSDAILAHYEEAADA